MRIPLPLPARIGTRRWLFGLGLALVASSCSFFTGESTTTTTAATTTAATTTSTTTTTTIAFPERSTTSTTLLEGVDPAAASRLQEQLLELFSITEAIRGLDFLEDPAITILTSDALAARVAADVAEELPPGDVAVDERLFRLLGMLDETIDLRSLLVELLSEQVVGFYDPDGPELVVAGDGAELTALQRSVVVHELIHALTDQHFAFDERQTDLIDADATDEAAALRALTEGDATYFQFLYIQGLPPADQLALAQDARSLESSALSSSPRWVQEDLAFPYDDGLRFVERLVDGGGIAAVDRAYLDPPESSEHILHPGRYLAGEVAGEVPELVLELDGYELHETGSFGEWGLRLLLQQSISPGLLTQTIDGWGADAYAVLDGGDDLAFVYAYRAETDADAIEVAEALVAHSRQTLGAGNGVEVDGGILFDEGGPWVFIDRIGDGLVFLVATDDDAGRALRPQVRVP